jgi:sugar phosphate permease
MEPFAGVIYNSPPVAATPGLWRVCASISAAVGPRPFGSGRGKLDWQPMTDSPRHSPPDAAAGPTHVRYLVLAGLCLMASIAYIERGCVSVPNKRIQEELKISKADMGNVLSVFFLSYALLQIPGGWLGGRFGTRMMLPMFAIVGALATACMGFAEGADMLLACRLISGAAQAVLLPGAVITMARWFPKSERAFASGMFTSFLLAGGMLGATLVGRLLNWFSWQTLFGLMAIPGIVWGIGFGLWFRNDPDDHPAVNPLELEKIRGPATQIDAAATASTPAPLPGPSIWKMLFGVSMVLICVQQFFRAAGFAFFQTWFPQFLQETRGATEQDAGDLTALAIGGGVVGCILGGWISDSILARTGNRRGARKGLAIAGLAGSAVCVFSAFFIKDLVAASVVITLGSFLAAVAGPVAYALSIDLGGRHVSTVFSTMNMAGNLGAMCSPKMVDWFVSTTDTSATNNNWNALLLMFALIYFLAGVCWFFLDTEKPLGGETVRAG